MLKRFLTLFAVIAIASIGTFAQKQTISLDDLFRKGTFRARSVYGLRSMNDGNSYTVIERGPKVVRYDYASGKQLDVIFDGTTTSPELFKDFAGYEFSSDESKLLISTDENPIYRHSFTATYYIYDIKTKSVEALSDNGQQMLATFSPDASKVAFVRGNNIFVKDLATKQEAQVTTDGEFNHIINGAADWVYEEEFALTTGMQWSPDGKKLAFYRFDESRVKQFNMNMFRNQLYPENYAYKYPKAGEDNSIVTIHVYNTATGSTNKMDIGPETNQYIARIKWTTNANELSMIRMNRLQNKLDILVADAATGNSRVLYSEENRYYVDEPADDYLTFTDDGKYFIIPSEKDGYNHLYVYGMDGALVRQLTTGTNEVKTIYGFDAKSKRVYYQAYDGSPMNTAVYFSTIDGKSSGKLSTQEGTNTADFSKGFKYYINFYSSVTVPTLVTLHNSKGKQVRVLEDNARLKETVAGYNMPQREFFTFITSEGVTLNGYMVKPLNFDANTKYPVMMYQYSGPGSQSVLNRWRIGWDEYLATNGYLVVCVDGRGTGGRGEAFKKMTYGQLGYYESIDQIEAAKYLQTLSYVEPSRIGIWGWSYGGYMSSLCLFKGADVFRMAIAVAPVTNWRYYDSIYTERYMGLPQDNPTGYDNNSPINHVEKLKGKLLIVHGTGDDNVHVQNSVEMIEKLVQANKPFDMMFYPDKNHGIYGGNTTMHLYNLMDSYIKENL